MQSTRLRSHGSAQNAAAWYRRLPEAVKSRVLGTPFRAFFRSFLPHKATSSLVGIDVLAERWSDCTYTFQFHFGEMTLTPLDIAVITGLQSTGSMPPFSDCPSDPADIEALIGLPLAPSEFRRVRSTQVFESYEGVGDPAMAVERDQHARCFLWFALCSTLFKETNDCCDLALLAGLRDLDRLGDYCWGKVVLAYAYRLLDGLSRQRAVAIGPTMVVEVFYFLLLELSLFMDSF
ncbi:hypothetical protein M5689_003227 [Euphorbia peplus]|nr:hypothetical protein M5689_003227 [Euphorbia peplus]